MTAKLTTGFAVAALGVVATLIVPLPPALLDALLALNIFGHRRNTAAITGEKMQRSQT